MHVCRENAWFRLGLLAIVLVWATALTGVTPAHAQKAGKGGAETYHGADKTNIDFGEASIDGKMQAPAGFFLQGRQSQAMTQMVKLRAKWRSELRNSKAAVRSLVR